jgi:uracil permease
VVLVIGVGGAALKLVGIHLEIEGMALATLVGMFLNLVLPKSGDRTEESE